MGLLTLYSGLLLPWLGGALWLAFADSRFGGSNPANRFRQAGYGFFLGYAVLFLVVMTSNKLTGAVSWPGLMGFLLIFAISGGIAAWLSRARSITPPGPTQTVLCIPVKVLIAVTMILTVIHLVFIAVEIFTQPVYPWDAWLAWVYRAKAWFMAGTMADVVSKSDWATATSALEKALDGSGLEWEEDPGEGVFYGPKIDIKIKDSLNRFWQVSTIQVDFNLPSRFEMSYIAEDGKPHQPIMIHRALMGSLERFFGCLIEHYAGAFPLWLAPVQVKLLPITDGHHEYVEKVAKKLEENDIRVEKDLRNEKIGFKIREAQLAKIPYMLVLGDKEVESENIAVRKRRSQETRTLSLDDFLGELKRDIDSKTIDAD